MRENWLRKRGISVCKKTLLIALSVCMIFLTGCEDVKWFETNEKASLKPLSDKELETNTYYVKQGTKFYKVYDPEIAASKSMARYATGDRVIPLYDNTQLLPSHYKNELIAYKSNDKILSDVTLERFKDLGYSFGFWGGIFDRDGYLYFDKAKTMVEKSNIGTQLKDVSSQDIRIVAIDGVPVSKDNVDIPAGVITGLKKNQTYKVQMYIGTQYCEAEITADTQMLQSYEMYSYDSNYISFTPNGYICFNTPNDLKSGYYNINGKGLFKYYSHEKGEGDDVDMNESYYQSEREKLEAYSRQYTIDINTKVKDVAIQIYYENYEEIPDEDIRGVVYSPSGIQYEMTVDTKEQLISLNLTEAEIGEWTINIAPKTLEIADVTVDSTKPDEEATLKSQEYTFEESETNVVFAADTEGPDDVYGYVVAPDGRTYDMIYDYDKTTNAGRIHYELAFADVGTYEVKIYYHPTTTTLSEITKESNMETETDVIYIN